MLTAIAAVYLSVPILDKRVYVWILSIFQNHTDLAQGRRGYSSNVNGECYVAGKTYFYR